MMPMQQDDCYAVGIMSGTSLDGIDIAVVRIVEKETIQLELTYFESFPYAADIKRHLLALCDLTSATIQLIASMNMLLGKLYADAALKGIQGAGLRREEIAFISSHGQTIYHQPIGIDIAGENVTATLQIGDISMIAERTGITTVGDFRTRDMAAGGQGAPLVPYADFLLFREKAIGRVLVNIGGISNITVLPANCKESDVQAYDTGPGNMIIDYFAKRMTNGKQAYDKDGFIAAKGKTNLEWLEKLLLEPYYAQQPPKSTGRELFGEEYARKLWDEAEERSISFEDRIATITELTAVTLANELNRYAMQVKLREVFVSGGGSNNTTLMNAIKRHMPEMITVHKTDDIGMPADAKEAMVFALLGYQYLNKRTNNLPAATGAESKVMMGKVAWGSAEGGE
ncbi:anhydro-N-acetylmuramic acid kinase [Ornithinibacillus contaminans]|uniref:anhydro-N-acetylmuramic acid kinase n=1 Tax=Ornithinibacillus contaminans TaxID=694055 RepID=UPI00064D9405|nr:anhydro-N-acetylmuramic acid kinase [Ornithinibacillus contaminans]